MYSKLIDNTQIDINNLESKKNTKYQLVLSNELKDKFKEVCNNLDIKDTELLRQFINNFVNENAK